MAESESSSGTAGIVAIFAIMMLLLIGAFIAWQTGVFGGRDSKKSLDVNVNTGQVSN